MVDLAQELEDERNRTKNSIHNAARNFDLKELRTDKDKELDDVLLQALDQAIIHHHAIIKFNKEKIRKYEEVQKTIKIRS